MAVKSSFVAVSLVLATLSVVAFLSIGAEADGSGDLHAAVYPGDSLIDFEWAASPALDGPTSYRIYRGLAPDNLSLYASELSFGFRDSSVENGVIYYYKIVAYNDTGEGTSSLLNAMPRPGPSDVQYSPHDVPNCNAFNLSVSWAMPTDNSSNVTAFKIYPEYGSAIVIDRNLTSTIVNMTPGWGPHWARLSAVFADGRESFAPLLYIYGPICEGTGDCGSCTLLLIGIIAAVVLIAVVIIFLILRMGRHP